MARAYFNLGYIYHVIKKEYSLAEAMYQRTVQISPDFLDDALYMLALSQNKLGKKQECIINLEQAIKINFDHKPATIMLDHLKKQQ